MDQSLIEPHEYRTRYNYVMNIIISIMATVMIVGAIYVMGVGIDGLIQDKNTISGICKINSEHGIFISKYYNISYHADYDCKQFPCPNDIITPCCYRDNVIKYDLPCKDKSTHVALIIIPVLLLSIIASCGYCVHYFKQRLHDYDLNYGFQGRSLLVADRIETA